MDKGISNRRRHPRHPIAVCAWLRFRDEDTARCTRSCDLAREGARFVALRPVRAAEPVILSLSLSGTRSMECKAVVCWSRRIPNGMFEFGVRFLDLRDEEYEQLDAALASAEQTFAVSL